ncbi:MAG TPA: beta-L-arabinofuranosidase domain-containing protein [Chloroflexota bacterium]|nr:beta-L-arabinofuranosidase domain-containing protein [Chloroflexota bacterium]
MSESSNRNRAPLQPGAFGSLPLGSIRPRGWLEAQLRLQAEGLTGKLGEVWPDVGPNSGWLGGSGEDWERGPYYCDGLIPLAYLLDDPDLRDLASRWVEWTIQSQAPDGSFGPRTNDDWWPRMVMLKVLTQYAEATDDPRVIPFLERYFACQLAQLSNRPLEKWGEARGAENILAVYWLYNRTGDPTLLELADRLIGQTLDWGTFFAERIPREKYTTGFTHFTHVVNVAMGVKEPAFRFLRSGAVRDRDAVYTALANLDKYHGQSTGIFSGDEWLAGREPSQGVELCAVVEFMFSLEHLIRIFGDASFVDRLERVAYNNLPATITADMRGRQYDQQWNQVLCTVARRAWTANGDHSNIFGIEPNFGCCTANLHQGWPKLAASLWLRAEAGLVAAVYAPCQVRARVANADVTVDEDTSYPFEDSVRFRVTTSQPANFSLLLRIPEWCERGVIRLNGEQLRAEGPGFSAVKRIWKSGDILELSLPPRLQVHRRPRGAIAIQRGPLHFALPVGEEWREIPNKYGDIAPFGDWEVYPTTAWNYALVVDPSHPERSLRVERGRVGNPPFAAEYPPLRVLARARRVPDWELVENSAGPVPQSPVKVDTPVEEVALVPYGCARLRVAELPYQEER